MTVQFTANNIQSNRECQISALTAISARSPRTWLRHVTRTPGSIPAGDNDRALLYVLDTHSFRKDEELVGRVIEAKAGSLPTTHRWPWVTTDGTNTIVSGVVVNDLVRPGERVWSPNRGTFTVAEVQTFENGHLLAVSPAGSRDYLDTWFRESALVTEDEQVREADILPEPESTADPKVEEVTERGLTAKQWAKKWDGLWAALAQEAQDRDWCSEYDDFAQVNGGPEREAEYEIDVTMTTEFGAGELDGIFENLLNSNGETVDVTGSADIEHRTSIALTLFPSEAENTAQLADRLSEHLQSEGWRFDDLQIDDITAK